MKKKLKDNCAEEARTKNLPQDAVIVPDICISGRNILLFCKKKNSIFREFLREDCVIVANEDLRFRFCLHESVIRI